MVRATFMPRPPPPKAALMAMGSPCSFAKAVISEASLTGSAVPGTRGAPALVAMWRAVTLSPRSRMDCGEGPIHVRFASSTAWANSAFSERKPYPGWIASAPDFAAASRIFAMSR
jgi:hypothetical protein